MHSCESRHAGHLKPFGSSGPFKNIDEFTNGFPDPVTFFENYVSKSRPVLFRQAIINDSHISLWDNDLNLNEIFLHNEDIVHVETRKKENRQQDILTMTMTEFLQRYQYEELYLVEEVPKLLRPYLTIPACLQCKPALDTFQVAMFWYSSGNTSSVLHTDDYDNINCVLQGEKQFILVDPHAHPKVAAEIIDNYSGSYSSMDVDRVDYNKYPSLDDPNLHYYNVTLMKGDCLFLPFLWVHQVRSHHRNIAVNYWLNHDRIRKAVVNNLTCSVLNESNFATLDTIEWIKGPPNVEYLRNFMLDLFNEEQISFKQWTQQFSNDLDFDLRSNAETISLFGEFFSVIDTDENDIITKEEIDSLFSTNNIATAYEILEDILDIVDAKQNQNQAHDKFVDHSDEESSSDDQQYNDNLSGYETEDDENDIHSEHEDL